PPAQLLRNSRKSSSFAGRLAAGIVLCQLFGARLALVARGRWLASLPSLFLIVHSLACLLRHTFRDEYSAGRFELVGSATVAESAALGSTYRSICSRYPTMATLSQVRLHNAATPQSGNAVWGEESPIPSNHRRWLPT